MKTYEIAVHGCDDSTIITEELTEQECNFIKVLAAKITHASEYGCMPIMEVKEYKEGE